MQQAARRLGQPTACVQGGEECRWFACSKPGRGGDILGVSCFKRMHHCHLGGPTSPRQHTVSGRSRASIRLQAEPPHQVLRGLTAQGLLAHVSQGLAAAHRALSPGTCIAWKCKSGLVFLQSPTHPAAVRRPRQRGRLNCGHTGQAPLAQLVPGMLLHTERWPDSSAQVVTGGPTSTRLMPCTMANLPARRLARLGITCTH